MNILVFDDRGDVLELIVSKLIKSGFTALQSCRTMYDADKAWGAGANGIDALVCDLSLIPAELNEDERKHILSTNMTGLEWLRSRVFKADMSHPMIARTILHSQYLDGVQEDIDAEKNKILEEGKSNSILVVENHIHERKAIVEQYEEIYDRATKIKKQAGSRGEIVKILRDWENGRPV